MQYSKDVLSTPYSPSTWLTTLKMSHPIGSAKSLWHFFGWFQKKRCTSGLGIYINNLSYSIDNHKRRGPQKHFKQILHKMITILHTSKSQPIISSYTTNILSITQINNNSDKHDYIFSNKCRHEDGVWIEIQTHTQGSLQVGRRGLGCIHLSGSLLIDTAPFT